MVEFNTNGILEPQIQDAPRNLARFIFTFYHGLIEVRRSCLWASYCLSSKHFQYVPACSKDNEIDRVIQDTQVTWMEGTSL